MKLQINWKQPVLEATDVLLLQPNDLDDFYITASDLDKGNLFCVLLASLHKYEMELDFVRSAHLSFLAAYYLFNAWTPPGSWELAMHYIQKAVTWNPTKEYLQWLTLMEKGN